MPSSPCASVLKTARRLGFVLLGVSVLALSLGACSGGRLTTDRASKELKPKEQLPDRELRNLPNNLIIKIDNVADDRGNYKNYVVLRINGREITPVERISNFSSLYTYPMRLQHGIYEVKAEYHDVGYWREHTYAIEPDEPVKISPNQRTVLEARLEKNNRGDLEENPVRFRISHENLVADLPKAVIPFPATATSSNIVVPALRDADEQETLPRKSPAPVPQQPIPVLVAPPASPPVTVPAVEPASSAPVNGATATLQINTSPAGADVIVDYRYYGQSPVKITVEKNQNHVIQISLQGYKEVVKILNAADLQNETLFQYVIKMEAEKSME